MAKKQPKQSAQQSKRSRQTPNQSAQPRQRSSGANAPRKNNAPSKQAAKPKRTNKEAVQEAATPGNILWRLSLILCVGLVVFSLLFASINGGSKYVGVTDDSDKEITTPTPPVASVDPNVNITGSDATPIPPSPTPGVDEATESGDSQPA